MGGIPRPRKGGQPGIGDHTSNKFHSIQRGGRPHSMRDGKTSMGRPPKSGCALLLLFAGVAAVIPFIALLG